MNYRHAELLASETITAAATRQPIDLKGLDPISRISILMKLTNNGSTPTDHPAKALVKAEIVDGSDILASLSGIQMQALSFYNNKKEPYFNNIFLDDVMSLMELSFDFGRSLYDPDLAFDPKNFKNPQLKIQHNLAAGGSAPDSMDLRVRADIFDGKTVSPMGYLMPKEFYNYSLASSGNEYIDLPVDHPIRMIMIMSRAAAKAPYEQYNQIKIDEDENKKVLIEGYASDLFKTIAGRYPLWADRLYGNAPTTGLPHFITPTFDAYPSLNAEGTNAAIYAEAFVNGGTKTIYGSAAANFHGLYSGQAPHGALPIPMGDQNDLEDWWDVTNLAKARLRITAGSAVESSSTCQVVTQQLRKY